MGRGWPKAIGARWDRRQRLIVQSLDEMQCNDRCEWHGRELIEWVSLISVELICKALVCS
jgi:hypothetical protein